jgi:hypothetical protein
MSYDTTDVCSTISLETFTNFITLFGSAGVAWALAARAQQGTKIPRTSILSPGRSGLPDPNFNMINAFVQGLHELGSEGQNLAI